MKLCMNHIARTALVLAVSAQMFLPVLAQGQARSASAAVSDDDPRSCAEHRDRDPERCIRDRDEGQNGITVGEPKVYDDALLQQMLRTAEARLAALQVFDQTAILSRLGAVTGASQQSSSFGLNVQGPSVPGVTTATTLPTQTTTQATAAGATNSSITTVSGLGTENVTTTQPAFTPPTAPAPPPTLTFPTGFSVSASDILNEQTQLAAEINGLRLLLAGSLSDHYIRNNDIGNELTKFKTTLGFPITVSPGRQYKDAVAIVEVEVKGEDKKSLSFPPELPAVTSIIPREKTYNVAAITDKSTSISGGVATQIIGFSGSWVRGHKTYYLVQDQDTVALTFRPADGEKIGFRWQFRPVLGQRYIKSGLKQTFVQLAFPVRPTRNFGQIGKVSVRTYWRKYDRKSGIVGDLIRGSYREMFRDFDIPRYSLLFDPRAFNTADHLEDLGGGQLLLRVPGRFLPGTTIRIGSTLLTEGARFKHDHQGIRFIASASDLASKKVVLLAHDGTEVPLRFRTDNCAGISVGTPEVTPVDEANSSVRVRVRVADVNHLHLLPLVFVFGSRVFGFSDAPILRESDDRSALNDQKEKVKDLLSAVVPNSVLAANPEMRVQMILTPESGDAQSCLAAAPLRDHTSGYPMVRLVLLEREGDNVKFLASGKLLSTLSVVSPTPQGWDPIGDRSAGDTLRVLTLKAAQVTANKFIVFRRGDGQPFVIGMPELTPPQPTPPKAKDTLTVNEDEAVIVGDGLRDVASITYKDQEVRFAPENEGKSLRMTGLRSLGATSSAAKKTFVLKFKSPDAKPKEVEFEVFDKKQEITNPKS
ncbi:MAG: hypothetical protein ABW250_09820 [Pyrinomonadaceae bacterium]